MVLLRENTIFRPQPPFDFPTTFRCGEDKRGARENTPSFSQILLNLGITGCLPLKTLEPVVLRWHKSRASSRKRDHFVMAALFTSGGGVAE